MTYPPFPTPKYTEEIKGGYIWQESTALVSWLYLPLPVTNTNGSDWSSAARITQEQIANMNFNQCVIFWALATLLVSKKFLLFPLLYHILRVWQRCSMVLQTCRRFLLVEELQCGWKAALAGCSTPASRQTHEGFMKQQWDGREVSRNCSA